MGRIKLHLLIPFCRKRHTMSTIYRPANIIAKEQKPSGKEEPQSHRSKSLSLLIDNGYIRPSSCNGCFHMLPLGQKVLQKLINVVDTFMERADCQKIQMPTLTSTALWNATGRLQEGGAELIKVSDRHSKSYVLSPTHEESICDLLNCHPISYRQLPLRLYQITEKFRDEKRPRFGLMRSRQFLMKDLYTFDKNEENSRTTYDAITELYGQLFSYLGLNWVKALGSTGIIGGTTSHEFHLLSEVGEDNLIHCHSCGTVFNEELLETELNATVSVGATAAGKVIANSQSDTPQCITCDSVDLSSSRSIEVGHAFLLGTKYTEPLRTSYVNEEGKPLSIDMGCYGIGVSRLLAAIVEVSGEKEIRWSSFIAPYLLSILPPKTGSREEQIGNQLYQKLLDVLQEMLGNDLIVDDRLQQTVGKRLITAKKLGIPYIIVFGKSLLNDPPLIELQDVNSGEVHMMTDKEIVRFMYDARTNAILK